jgi:hypothetical protein
VYDIQKSNTDDKINFNMALMMKKKKVMKITLGVMLALGSMVKPE